MTSPIHDFVFDVNFGFGSESVFSLVDTEEIAPFPPDEGYFLQTDNTPLQLTTLEFLALA